MKKQGYNSRLDESLGAKHGKKSQSMKSRRDESEGKLLGKESTQEISLCLTITII